MAVKNIKEHVISFIKTLPDDATLDRIMYHLYVMKKIQQGLKDADEGRTIPHKEVKKQMKKWFKSYNY